MSSQDSGLGLSAVHTYFDGERRELLAMLGGAVLFVAATALLGFVLRDGFTRGLFGVFLVFGLVFGGGAVSLLVRDVDLRSGLAAALAATPTAAAGSAAREAKALDEEKARIAVVLSKFPAYRIVALALGVLALIGLAAFPGGWVHGAAAGLLVVAASQAIIDHGSESRARLYLQRLAAVQAR